MGFSLHAAVFLNQTYIEPYFKLRAVLQSDRTEHQQLSVMTSVSFCLEWVFHLATGLLSILMGFVLYSSESMRCVNERGSLLIEASWLFSLALIQIVKIGLFIYLKERFGQIEDIVPQASLKTPNRGGFL